MGTIIQLEGVTKTYKKGGAAVDALKDIALSIDAGERVAIMGPSGSGKSTLLQLIGGLDGVSSGTLLVADKNPQGMNDRARSMYRKKTIGFVFQQFYLQPFLSAEDNVALPMRLNKVRKSPATKKAHELLGKVGLADKSSSRPSQLSGGEMQRVAIARALANNPAIVLADEPTGNLDRDNADKVMEIFSRLSDDGTTVIVVTHDEKVAEKMDRIIKLENGKIESDITKTVASKKPSTSKGAKK